MSVSETVGGIRRQQVPPTPTGEVDVQDREYPGSDGDNTGVDSGN